MSGDIKAHTAQNSFDHLKRPIVRYGAFFMQKKEPIIDSFLGLVFFLLFKEKNFNSGQ